MNSNPLHQLPLRLRLQDDALFQNFFVGPNQQLLQILMQFATHQFAETFIYCYGNRGAGCSHLLQACCHAANQLGHSIFYFSLRDHENYTPQVLDELENVSLICIDDVDVVMRNVIWEESLFHCYNRVREKNRRLLLSAHCPPKQLLCKLPDLQTRLSGGLALEVIDLNDEEKMHALQMRADNRGFALSDEVAQFLLRHYSRNMHDLLSILDTLDHASLIAKRKLTIPFVKKVIVE